MPANNPLVLPNPTPEQVNDVRGDGTRLSLVVSWLDTSFHLTLLRVTETPCDIESRVVESVDHPMFDHCELRADDCEDQADLETLWSLHDAYYEAVRVPGFEGEYVAFMAPFDR